MRKKLLATTLLSAFLLTLSPMPQALAADTVQVTLPSFSVTLNGQTTGNDYSKYPLLVYKDITYFPMTYYDCRLLGLKTDWTADTGLVIDKNKDYFYEYLREVNNSKNARKQTAKLADGKITVNGKVIDNSKEEYPLLVFRDVTYFPLTWRFAVNEFGWDYRFDQKEGLVIDNDKVKLENPEEWTYNNEYWTGGMGMEDPITVTGLNHFTEFSKSKVLQTPFDLSIGIYNVTGKNIYFQDFGTLKYCIFKKTGQREELIYWHLLPPYRGTLNASAHACYQRELNFWQKAVPGQYIEELQLPAQCTYQETDTGEWLTGQPQGRYFLTKSQFTLTA